ncbi:hypothetical protein [uncultured Roseobacter sp.]|uniref:hypothetical protein n=1 Tax=uncultured Roseobacter sp. TaxID=114847 RepID=UPI00260653CE|nr:hypothetical protein [uncultured Roseobacter sp.]
MVRRLLSRAGFVALLLASLAMTGSAFAHRVANADHSPELLSYLSMGGLLEDICGDADASHALSACAACIISSNALTPAHADLAVRPFHTRPADLCLTTGARISHSATDRTHPTRAPPAV